MRPVLSVRLRRDVVAVLRAPASVREIDAEIVRLQREAERAADVLDRELARLQIDELLEQRFALTGAARG